MKNMDNGRTVPKWVLINWLKIPQMPKKIVWPSPKVGDFDEERLHWASVLRVCEKIRLFAKNLPPWLCIHWKWISILYFYPHCPSWSKCIFHCQFWRKHIWMGEYTFGNRWGRVPFQEGIYTRLPRRICTQWTWKIPPTIRSFSYLVPRIWKQTCICNFEEKMKKWQHEEMKKKYWYFVIKIVMTYCEKKLF